jgi:cytidine deaminase
VIEIKRSVSLQILQWDELSSGERYLLQSARAVRKNASAPYFHYTVGATILWGNHRVSTGCNVENCVYNAIHAEKCAISIGIAENGPSKIEEIAVCGGPENDERPLVTRKIAEDEFRRLAARIKFTDASFSCGQCLQDILEYSYGQPENVIMLESKDDGLILRSTLDDVLPGRFGPADLGIHYGKVR